MKNVSIQVIGNKEDFIKAENSIVDIYDWLSNSSTGTTDDLLALNKALEVFGAIIFQLIQQEGDDGL